MKAAEAWKGVLVNSTSLAFGGEPVCSVRLGDEPLDLDDRDLAGLDDRHDDRVDAIDFVERHDCLLSGWPVEECTIVYLLIISLMILLVNICRHVTYVIIKSYDCRYYRH